MEKIMEKLSQFISTQFFTFTVSGREIAILAGLILVILVIGGYKWKKKRNLIDEDLENAAKGTEDKNEIGPKKDSQVLFDSRLNTNKEPIQSSPEINLPESSSQEKSTASDSFYDERIEKLYNKRQGGAAEDQNKLSSRSKFIIIAVISVLVIGSASYGICFYLKNKNSSDVPEKKSLLTTENNESEAGLQVKTEENKQEEQSGNTEEKKVEEKKDPATVKTLVLNGGAAGGSAGKIKQKLIDLGYKKTEADNAESSSHSGQIAYYLEGFEANAQEIVEALKSQYPEITTKKAESVEEKRAEIVIMLGQ